MTKVIIFYFYDDLIILSTAHITFSQYNYAYYTPGTAGGGRDRTLAVKSRKIAQKSAFFNKKK